jgi:hypothetical protein
MEDGLPSPDFAEGRPGPLPEAWEQGWNDGVVEFYGKVKEKMFQPLRTAAIIQTGQSP